MFTTNYIETFIQVADDCPVAQAEIPALRNGQRTAALIQFEMIRDHAYQFTSDDVIFQVYIEKNAVDSQDFEAERARFFSTGQPCLRSSPLVKRYGWGIHSDAQGRVALYARESAEYQQYLARSAIKHLKGMKSRR